MRSSVRRYPRARRAGARKASWTSISSGVWPSEAHANASLSREPNLTVERSRINTGEPADQHFKVAASQRIFIRHFHGPADAPGWALPHVRAALGLLRSWLVPGILGALFASLASNAWFYYIGAFLGRESSARGLMPDAALLLAIDLFVGAGCGYAGSLSGPNVASLFAAPPRQARRISWWYTFVLGTSIALIVNVLLLVMTAV